jgi:hypothetical protein
MALQAEVGPLVWTSSDDGGREAARQHAAIVDAIRRGEPAAARAAAEEHVRHDMNRLIDARMAMETRLPGSRRTVQEDATVQAIKDLAMQIEETAAAAARAVDEAVHTTLAEDGTPGELTDVYEAAQGTLRGGAPVLYGVGFLGESSFYGEPTLAWSYMPPDRTTPLRLEMDLQFYDYASAPWWPDDEVEEHVQASYAYVDANGSNAYIITFSKKVVKDDRMIGAAAADVLIGQLQAQFAPLLESLPAGSCVVDQNNVVIATNSGSLIGGIFSPEGHENEGIALPAVPWRLHIGRKTATT